MIAIGGSKRARKREREIEKVREIVFSHFIKQSHPFSTEIDLLKIVQLALLLLWFIDIIVVGSLFAKYKHASLESLIESVNVVTYLGICIYDCEYTIYNM